MALLYGILVIVCFVGCNCTSQLMNNYRKDPTFANMMCPTDQVEFQRVTRSAIGCVSTCDRTPGCSSLVYLPDSKTCFGIKSDNPFSTSSPLPGAVFYKPCGSSQVTTASPSVTTATVSTSGSTGEGTTTASTTLAATSKTATTTELSTTIGPGTPMVIGVADSQLTASSYYTVDPGYTASDAKFNNTDKGWGVADGYADTMQYIQVDFLHQIQATHVITKGIKIPESWVKTYKVLTSTDCVSFVDVQDGQGNDKIFTGNVDTDSEVMNALVPPVICRCFRINPQSWNVHLALRFEVLGYVV